MSFLSKLRRGLYRGVRVLGDIGALLSLKPTRIVKRGANKLIGRKVVRRLYSRGGSGEARYDWQTGR